MSLLLWKQPFTVFAASSINKWWINSVCMQSTNVSACLLRFASDLLKWCVSELCEVMLLLSAAAKVFCWSEEPRYTEQANAAIFQMAEGDVCALTLQYTHIKAKADMFISTHRQRREVAVVVKWQAKGTEWGGATGCVTMGQGHAVCYVRHGWCFWLYVCMRAGMPGSDKHLEV